MCNRDTEVSAGTYLEDILSAPQFVCIQSYLTTNQVVRVLYGYVNRASTNGKQ